MEKQIKELTDSIMNLKETLSGDVKSQAAQVKDLQAKLAEVAKANGDQVKGYEELKKTLDEMGKQLDDVRKQGLADRQSGQAHLVNGMVSTDCAKFLGAIAMIGAMKQRQDLPNREALEKRVKEVMGVEVMKTALSTSDIPMPDIYSGQILELVATYGAARRLGTVFPMGGPSIKLPRLKTSPAFALVGVGSGGGEKVPQFEFVTLAPSKWGGIVRIPSEIDADSIVALGQFIARYCAREMAKLEDTVFFAADGTATYDSLKGLKLMVAAANNNKLLIMGEGKTKPSDATLTNLRSLRAVVDSAVLGQSRYVFHPTWEQFFCSLNNDRNIVYQAAGLRGATLDGFPIEWVEAMPVYSSAAAASTVFGLFGDLSYQYFGVRAGMSVQSSTEAGFTTDEILIRALERFTIANMAAGAVAGLQTAA
jgi:HK97 family phage major capsid protein